jgi:hypothetical protein
MKVWAIASPVAKCFRYSSAALQYRLRGLEPVVMFVRIGFDLEFAVQSPTTVLMMLYPHPSREATVRGNTAVRTEPNLRVDEYLDMFGNHCGRLAAPAGSLRLWSDAVVEDSGRPEPTVIGRRQHAIDELPVETLQFLLPSRYCEVDRFSDLAWKLFGHLPPGGDRVQAVLVAQAYW